MVRSVCLNQKLNRCGATGSPRSLYRQPNATARVTQGSKHSKGTEINAIVPPNFRYWRLSSGPAINLFTLICKVKLPIHDHSWIAKKEAQEVTYMLVRKLQAHC